MTFDAICEDKGQLHPPSRKRIDQERRKQDAAVLELRKLLAQGQGRKVCKFFSAA